MTGFVKGMAAGLITGAALAIVVYPKKAKSCTIAGRALKNVGKLAQHIGNAIT